MRQTLAPLAALALGAPTQASTRLLVAKRALSFMGVSGSSSNG